MSIELKPIELTTLKKNYGFRETKNLEILREFADSDYECVEVTGYSHKSPSSCQGSFNRSIERYRMTGIVCKMHKGKVYLIKRSSLEK